MTNRDILLGILVASFVTIALRAIPFLLFNGKGKTPKLITYLSKYLPYAIMAMLVVYCLRGIQFTAAPYGMAEIISCIVVALLHIWRRNTLISIISGTVCYMALVQLVFV